MTGRLRRGALASLAVVVAVFLGTGAATAQEVPPVEIVGTDMSEFPTVRLSVAASGDAAGEIDPDEIQLTENGEPIDAEIVPLSEEVIDVVLAIDVSGSMAGEPLTRAKAAAVEFLDELPAQARTAIVSFESTAQVVSGLTTDRDESRAAVEGLTEGEGTALYDGIGVAVDQVTGSDAARSAIVVLSDGADTSSTGSLEQATAELEGLDTDFFVVSLGNADTAALNDLATAAGGQVISAADPDALEGAYVDLGQRISNQYDLVFQSITDDRTATFQVEVPSIEASDSVEIALPDRGSEAAAPTTTEVAQVPRLVSEVDAGPLAQSWAMWAGIALVALALAVTAYIVVPSAGNRTPRRSLESDRAEDPDSGAGERIVTSIRDTATRIGSRAVERSEQTGVIDARLDRAGIIMRAGEFVALVAGIVVVAAVVLYLLMGPVGIAFGIFLPIILAPTVLNLLASRRNAKFADQLGDTLLLMAGSLRSGFGLGSAIDSVGQEMEAPIGTEFQRAILETRLGRSMEDALAGIAKRVQNEDFEWVVDAMRIHKQVGGDLAQILDQVSETIRARNRLRRQINALTAEGRLSGVVLGVLPIGMAFVLYTSNPDYLEPLFTETAGRIMLGVAVLLLTTGALWLKKLITVDL